MYMYMYNVHVHETDIFALYMCICMGVLGCSCLGTVYIVHVAQLVRVLPRTQKVMG